jgi:DNA-binding winged helix-turn-helix (wHTH) protein/TolB-like protein/Tfp pilus assembly protein PilF
MATQMQPASSRFYEFGAFRVDTVKRVLLREGEPVSLSPKAFDTLLMLVQHAGEVLEKDRLMDLLWPDSDVEEANLPLNISALRKALGETPNERGYITTIPGRGYRFAAAVQVLDAEEADLVIERRQRATVVIHEHDQNVDPQIYSSERLLPAAASATSRWKRSIVIVAALGLLGAAVAVILFRRGVEAERSPTLVKSLAVLPFKPLGEPSGDDYLGLGIADSLITRLSNLRQVIVRPTSSVSRRSLEGKQLVDIGRELRVEAVLEGRYHKSGDRIGLTVQLVKVEDGSIMWGHAFDEKETDILTLEDTMAERVAAALVPRLTGEEKRTLAKHGTDNPEAYFLYLQGRFFWGKRTPDGQRKGNALFKQAIDKDPNYALAYAGLADGYRTAGLDPGEVNRASHLPLQPWDRYRLAGVPNEGFPRAKYYALKALELDDSLAEAHVALATIMFQYDLDLAGADSEYKRAFEVDPNYSYGHAIYAQYLSFCGRFDEAAAEIKRAREIDPLERSSYRVEGFSFYLQGHFDEAIEVYRTVLEMYPGFYQGHRELGLAYEGKGMYEEALKELQLSLSQSGGSSTLIRADIGHVYAVRGKRSKAQKILEELQSKLRHVSAPYNVAVIYAGLGEKDKALEWLEKDYEVRSFWLTRIKVDPRLAICRTDPRFTDLVRKVGLQ